jgi:GH15 family glucan-1,4-alpha-glucosidase
MSKPIEDYGFIGNMLSGALIARDGSMDWLCLPRFDSDACFAALLGTRDNGSWRIAPQAEGWRSTRRYLPQTPILETTFETADGKATLTDFMPLSPDPHKIEVVRLVRGVEGKVNFCMDLALRFGFGITVPWVRRRDYGLHAVAGPDAVELVTPVALRGENLRTVADFTVGPDDVVPFTLTYHPSGQEPHFVGDAGMRLANTEEWWRKWTGACSLDH